MKPRTLVLLVGMIASTVAFSAQNAMATDRGTERIEKKVRHELNMLPYGNVFDYLTFTVDENGTVSLMGQVTRPVVKSEAARAAKSVEGVEHVDNQIKVLPVSFFDSQLRAQLYRSIYGYPTMQRYGLGVNAPIRIIVENGHVTLLGIVDNQGDKIIAGMQANIRCCEAQGLRMSGASCSVSERIRVECYIACFGCVAIFRPKPVCRSIVPLPFCSTPTTSFGRFLAPRGDAHVGAIRAVTPEPRI